MKVARSTAAGRDRKLEEARKRRQIRRQQAAKKGLISPSSVVADTSKRFAVDREFRWMAGQRSGRSASHCNAVTHVVY